MPLDRVAKRNMLSFLFDAWNDGITNGLPQSEDPLVPVDFNVSGAEYRPEMFFHNIEKRNPVEAEKHFCLVVLSNTNTVKATISGGRVQSAGRAIRTTIGIGIIQFFFSKSNYSTAEDELLIAILHEALMRSSPDCVIIRNPTVKDLPTEEAFFRKNIIFEYEFDTHI